MHIVICGICPFFLSDFSEAGIFRSRFSQNSQILKFMNIRPVGAQLFRADKRTSDRHDEANSRFSRFGERASAWLQGRIYERLLCCCHDQLNCVTQYTLFLFFKFKGPCIVKYMPIIVQQDATIYSLFTSISVNRSTCFGWYLHPSSGARVTVSTASGISKSVTTTCRERDWTAFQSRYAFTKDGCCRYSDMSSWWWVKIPPETCRAVYRYK